MAPVLLEASLLYITVIKYLRKISLQEERVFLGLGFKDFRPGLLGPITVGLW
jgi:hypothetical protein